MMPRHAALPPRHYDYYGDMSLMLMLRFAMPPLMLIFASIMPITPMPSR